MRFHRRLLALLLPLLAVAVRAIAQVGDEAGQAGSLELRAQAEAPPVSDGTAIALAVLILVVVAFATGKRASTASADR